MKKLLQVKEFDSIGYNQSAKNKKYHVIEKKQFEYLKRFILEYKNSCVKGDAPAFFKESYSPSKGEYVLVQNYVGLIQLQDGTQIEILPKLGLNSKSTDKDNQATKEILLKMLNSIKGLVPKGSTNASLQVTKMNLYEIFIRMYLEEVRNLVKKGIKSGYVKQEDNLPYKKGKLLVRQHLTKNAVHKERFYVEFDEFHQNRPENIIVKSTLVKLQKLTTDFTNSRDAKQLLAVFESVDISTNYSKDFSKITISRENKEYEMLMNWSKVFLMNNSFSIFSGNTKSKAILFPMEMVFESYVAQELKRVMSKINSEDKWDILIQDESHFLFKDNMFKLKPDIVMQKNDTTIILDTKWKKLINDKEKNYNIKASDIYQMCAYSTGYKAKEVWLLYPYCEEMKEYEGKNTIEFDGGDKIKVKIHFIKLDDIEKNLKELISFLPGS